jgi:DNA-binding response OmpR family regulator
MNHVALIVDDSLTVRMDLAHAFDSAGFTAVPTATVADARAALERQPADVIVLDVMLPDGDGVDLLGELRTRPELADAVILMLSTEAEVRDRVRGMRNGADEYIGKPYDTRYVIAKSRELLRVRQAAGPSSPTVLLISGSAPDAGHLAGLLGAEGYPLVTADTGEEGLRVAADRRPDAVIVDGFLPDIDGPTVIRRLRLDAALRDVPCLLLTADDDQTAELLALDAGADAFIRKGDSAVVLARLAAVLRGSDRVTVAGDTASLLGPNKLLVVDHDAARAERLAAPLRDDGYDVILARSRAEALRLVAHQPVECLLLDPATLDVDAAQACQSIRAAVPNRTVPVIIVEEHADQAATVANLIAGADDVIVRSDPPDVLKARIRSQIRRKRFEDYNHRIREELIRRDLAATEARAAQQVAEARVALTEELERRNQELESFSYSVSHDLRGPLQSLIGFNQLLLDSHDGDLDEEVTDCVRITLRAASRMAELVDDLLQLSHVSGSELTRGPVDLSALAKAAVDELRQREPGRPVTMIVQDGVTASADGRLVRILIENLLGNAWKYTKQEEHPTIEFGRLPHGNPVVFFLRDNGAGFDMAGADRLFRPFARLHTPDQFPGTGIGLATVRRIVDRHGGRIWAEAAVGRGATFFFSLVSAPAPAPGPEPDCSTVDAPLLQR